MTKSENTELSELEQSVREAVMEYAGKLMDSGMDRE